MKQFLRSFLPHKIDGSVPAPPAAAPPVVKRQPPADPFQRACIRIADDLGAGPAAETIERVKVFTAAPPVDAIERLGATRFAGFLAGEHPEAAALFVAALPEKLQRQVVDELEPALRFEVRDRLS